MLNKRYALLVLMLIVALVTVACGGGAADTAPPAAEEDAAEVEEAVDEAGEELEDTAEEAGAEVEEAVEDAADEGETEIENAEAGAPTPEADTSESGTSPETEAEDAETEGAFNFSAPASVANQDAVTLQMWSGSSSPAEEAALEARVAAFEEANPNIDVELLISPEYATQLQSAFASGDYPDVFTVGQDEFNTYRDSGVLMAAEDRISDPEGIYPNLLAAFTYEDTVYCPPKDFSTLALFYNRDLFDAAGVEYPTGEETWEELYAIAEQVNGTEDAVGISIAPDIFRWLAFFYANGGEFFAEDGSASISSEEGIASLQYYTSFVENGIGDVPANLDAGWNGEAFGEGAAAMTIEGNWLIGAMEEGYSDVNYGVAQLPTAPSGEKGTLTFTVCWAVGANTENPEEAWQLVNFLTDEEGALAVAESGFGVMPARSSAAEAWLEARGEEFVAFIEGAEYATAPVFPLGFADFRDELVQNIDSVITGEEAPEDYLEDAAEVAQDIVEEMQ